MKTTENSKKLSILALDDAATMRTVLQEILGSDFKLYLAASVQEFKETLEDITPDIFILDVILPDGNGIEICRNLRNRKEYKDSVIILITASNKNETIEEGYDAGTNDFIRKPIIPYEVKSKIQLYEKFIHSRESLNTAYEFQLQQNKRLHTMTGIVRDHIKTRDIEESFLIAERVAAITSSGYLETVKKKEETFVTVLSRCINQDAKYRPFDELNSRINITDKTEKGIGQFRIKSGSDTIHCLFIPLIMDNSIFGYILLENSKPFPDEDIEIVELFTSFFP